MHQLVYLSSARRDLEDILKYLTRESGNRTVSRAFVNRIREQCRKLAMLPGTLGRKRPELRHDLRSFPIHGYVIFFRYGNDRFEVINILEGHRDIEQFFDEQ